jgi:predicted TIM-barrel fold metal-dependent hydrolase
MPIIDIHQHFLPPAYLDVLNERGIELGGGLLVPTWDVESTLALMDRYGIEKALLSISEPGVYFGDARQAQNLARYCNEYAAELIRTHPGRFGAFATLPLPDVDAALRELEYVLDTLKLDGVILLSNSDGRYPGDALFNDLFDELNQRKALVLIHPALPAYHQTLRLNLPPMVTEFVFDTTRAVVNLLYSGTLERCPDLRLIVAHAGGTVPYLAMRITLGQVLLPGAPQGAMQYLKQLYFDTAFSASAFTFRTLQELADPSHILFGSDYPFGPEISVLATIRGIETYDGFDAEAQKLVQYGNAEELLLR